MDFLYVFLFGGVGCSLRYLISKIPVEAPIPVMTLLINAVGSFLLGYLSFSLGKHIDNEYLNIGLRVGLCGGFTTYSTFAVESFGFFTNGDYIRGITYILLTIVICLLAVGLAYRISM